MSKKQITIGIIIALVIAGGVGTYIWKTKENKEPVQENNTAAGASEHTEAPPDYVVTEKSPTMNQYKNTKYYFSFVYPKEYRVTAFFDGSGDVVLMEGKAGKDSFQIYISPFDEDSITPARIKRDMPKLAIENPERVLTGADKKIPALIFYSKDGSIGKTREVWFVHQGYLYQVTGSAELDQLIGGVMDTLIFDPDR